MPKAKRQRMRLNPGRAARAAIAVGALAWGAGAASAADCGGLAGKTVGDFTITAATNVSPPRR